MQATLFWLLILLWDSLCLNKIIELLNEKFYRSKKRIKKYANHFSGVKNNGPERG